MWTMNTINSSQFKKKAEKRKNSYYINCYTESWLHTVIIKIANEIKLLQKQYLIKVLFQVTNELKSESADWMTVFGIARGLGSNI
jgi:hypothetical protein